MKADLLELIGALNRYLFITILASVALIGTPNNLVQGQTSVSKQDPTSPVAKQEQSLKKTLDFNNGELSWEMPGRLSIYDLQLGSAALEEGEWKFLGASRTFNAGLFKDRLTIMIRFMYKATSTEIPLKFVIKLPDSRQYEETVKLTGKNGHFNYQFTIHKPEEFLGAGMVYVYYGFNIVDVLDFTIVPGS
ncbi:MAG: hypothetical protein PHS86_08635 [Syntrophaceae bacterium]|nr:hypothetical protein [Syntrophaceae bacterium]